MGGPLRSLFVRRDEHFPGQFKFVSKRHFGRTFEAEAVGVARILPGQQESGLFEPGDANFSQDRFQI